jgi:starch synthase
MRAALFTREYPPHIYGGAGVHVEYLSRELAKTIEVEVHCWGEQNFDEGDLHVRGAEPWGEITGGATGKFKAALETVSLNLTQVKALEGIDLVHTHTWYASMAGFFAKKLYNVPFVLTTHSLEPLRGWKAEQLGSGYAMSSWIERTAILDADAVIAVSKGTRDDILRVYPVDPERIHVIYNGIDLTEYRKTSETSALVAAGVDPAVPYVLFLGRITRQKGVTHLVDAIPYLPPGTQVVLCAGAPDTPEIGVEMRQKVEAARQKNPRIVWIEKMMARPDAIQLYSHARVFCCPSVYEPFGIINLEAMACGAPVVASATGGIPEVVVDNETGFLVPFDQDPATSLATQPEKFARDLAAKINDLLGDPEKCHRFGEAGRRRVEQKFSWTTIAAETIALYHNLIARNKQRGSV